jgi:hypothetical protein
LGAESRYIVDDLCCFVDRLFTADYRPTPSAVIDPERSVALPESRH